MLLQETIALALSSLRANKLRSFLTMLGIVIGIAAVIAMIALGNGAQQSVQARIQAFGTNLLQVDATRVSQNGVRLATFRRIRANDADMLRDSSTYITDEQAQQDQNEQITFKNLNTNIRIIGTTANYLAVRKYELDLGRMFTAREDSARRRVAVLGSDVLEALGETDPLAALGQNIRIKGIQFQVIGILKATCSCARETTRPFRWRWRRSNAECGAHTACAPMTRTTSASACAPTFSTRWATPPWCSRYSWPASPA